MDIVEEKMNGSGKIFLIALILIIASSLGFGFWSIVVERDYQIVSEVSCDTATESCFHFEPSACDSDDTACLATLESGAYDYKLISKNASTIYKCEQTEEKLGCGEELSCTENEPKCSYTFCDPLNLADGEVCATDTAESVPENSTTTKSTGTPETVTP